MKMSPACTAPIQPTSTAADHLHPRYNEYLRYRTEVSRQLVAGLSFRGWLGATEQREQGYEVVFHTLPGAQLAPGWYKHIFAPGSSRMTRVGPFDTEAQARAAVQS